MTCLDDRLSLLVSGVAILIPCYACIGLVPSDIPIYLVYVLCGIAGFAIGSAYLIPWSMLPDVIDNYTVEHFERNESIFFGFFVFFNKFAAGAGLGISMAVLEVAGYSNEACAQPDAVQTALRLLCSPGPGTLVFLYSLFVFLYPITDEVIANNKDILNQRRRQEHYHKDQQFINSTFVDDGTITWF